MMRWRYLTIQIVNLSPASLSDSKSFPSPLIFNRESELSFYNNFFDAVAIWADPKGILDHAFSTACKFGLSAVDSLHVSAALSAGATEFVTTELPTKPLHRVPDISVTTI